MRKLLTAFALTLCSWSSTMAQSQYVYLHFTDGESVRFSISENHKLTYDARNVKLVTNTLDIEYSMEDIQCINYSEISTVGIENTIAEPTMESGEFHNRGGIISMTNFLPNSIVNVYNANGALHASYNVSDDGSLEIDITNYAAGVYIFKSNNNSYKIYKK